MEQEDKPTYNKLHFTEMSQALKSNILRRKAAKQEKESENEASKSDQQ
jgi:hypothetical protein